MTIVINRTKLLFIVKCKPLHHYKCIDSFFETNFVQGSFLLTALTIITDR